METKNNYTNEITFINFNKSCKSGRGQNVRTVFVSKPTHRMAFSTDLTETLDKYAGIRIAQNNLTGDVYFVLDNSSDALELRHESKESNRRALYIRDVINWLITAKCPIDTEKVVFALSDNLSRTASQVTWKIESVKILK